jgi:hypothetical protein
MLSYTVTVCYKIFNTKEESLFHAYENTKWQIPSESLPAVIHLIRADASAP